jgi:hypothetical protein
MMNPLDASDCMVVERMNELSIMVERVALLTVYIRVKVQVDLQVDKSFVVVKGPFFPHVMNPRYRIHGTNV